ncbi:MAG: hypothetical protein GEV03_01135 [Streptosporangiales bacterium]|nr:hypothetical protein [Streptosporangiales bacterium]
MGWGLGLLAASAVLLVAGAELFVENAAGAARRLRVTVLAVGLLLAGAEPEELITAVMAAAQERPGLAAGDAIGANLTILTLVLGLAALARPLPFGRRVRSYAALSAAAGALAAAVLAGGQVSRLEGAGLLLAYVALVALVWWREREAPCSASSPVSPGSPRSRVPPAAALPRGRRAGGKRWRSCSSSSGSA